MVKTYFSILLSFVIYSGIGQTETDLIKKTLNNYIEGSTNGKPKILSSAFHPDLFLYYVKKDEVATWSGKDYILDTKEGQPTGEKGEILSVDFENDAAIAKVKIYTPDAPSYYIDYFLLLKLEDKWTIIHKMFTKYKEGNDSERDQIKNILYDYMDGTAQGSPERIKKAFHPDLNLYSVRNNQINIREGSAYISLFEQGVKHNRIGKIISIDHTNNAAVAKLEIAMPDRGSVYTDYMMMLKTKGKWQIIHKSYTKNK